MTRLRGRAAKEPGTICEAHKPVAWHRIRLVDDFHGDDAVP